jgi:hypothetical protein
VSAARVELNRSTRIVSSTVHSGFAHAEFDSMADATCEHSHRTGTSGFVFAFTTYAMRVSQSHNMSFEQECEEFMKRILTGAAVLGFAVLSSTRATAQTITHSPIQFGVMGGASFPTGSFNNNLNVGWNAGALLNFGFVNSPVGLRVDGVWNQFHFKNVSDSPRFRVLDATADAVFNFSTSSPAQFYLIGGVGVYNFKITDDNHDFDFSSNSTTKFGLNGGLGLKFKAGAFAPFVEARYHYVFSGSAFTNTTEDSPKFQMIPISVGLTF